MSLRARLVAIAEQHAMGSREPMRHTHIECNCHDRAHRRSDYDIGCFCPDCAAAAALKLGYPSTDVEPEAEGPDDSPQWCEDCGRLITLRSTPDLEWGVSPDGALEELEHYETGMGFEKGEPKTPEDWQVFLLMLDSLDESQLHRAEAIIARRVLGGKP